MRVAQLTDQAAEAAQGFFGQVGIHGAAQVRRAAVGTQIVWERAAVLVQVFAGFECRDLFALQHGQRTCRGAQAVPGIFHGRGIRIAAAEMGERVAGADRKRNVDGGDTGGLDAAGRDAGWALFGGERVEDQSYLALQTAIFTERIGAGTPGFMLHRDLCFKYYFPQSQAERPVR